MSMGTGLAIDSPTTIDYPGIRALLPVHHPNLLVDRVVRCEPGMMIETVKAVSAGESCYAHLADAELDAAAYHYPDAMLLESFIQAATLLWARTRGRPFAGMPVLTGSRGIGFHHPAPPGVQLRTVVKLIPGTETTTYFSGRTTIAGGPLVLTVDNLALVVRRPRPAPQP